MIRIDEEFKSLIPPLAENERAALQENILQDGCRDPLVVWGGVLVDGHNRFEICTAFDIDFKTVEMEFADRESAMDWIDRNQIGRRNLKPDVFKLVLGRIYNREKKNEGAQKGNTNRAIQLDQNEPVEKPQPTAVRIAADHGVSPATVKRAGKLAEVEAEVRKEAAAPTQDIQKPAAPSQEDLIAEAKRRIRAEDEAKQATKKAVHVSHNSGENEWYTPAKYIAAARATMGIIDTDPASSEIANKTVGAVTFFNADQNGLVQTWGGNVWMNPPYAQPLIKDFATAVADKYKSGEIKQAIVLVNNATETEWFGIMAAQAAAICFPSGRIRFIDKEGKPSGAPLQGQAFLYIGGDVAKFAESFAQFGLIVEVHHAS